MLQALKQVPLKKFNTFGIDAMAENLIEISNNQEIREAVDMGRNMGSPSVIIGGGSNILFTRLSYPLIVANRLLGIKKIDENEDFVWVESGAGEIWHGLVLHCTDQGWGGLENLSLIPGTVGAAPMQNIGAYGVEFKEVFESLEAVSLTTFETRKFSNSECLFGYRESVFKRQLKGKYFITSVVLKLSKNHRVNTGYGAIREVLKKEGITRPTIKQVSDAVVRIRQAKLPDPAAIGNAGSFFKNPALSRQGFERLKQNYPDVPGYPRPGGHVRVPAGWLIEKCGWKGNREGHIGVHKQQSLVLVNYGGGKGAEVRELAMRIKSSVQDKFQIEIMPEVNIL